MREIVEAAAKKGPGGIKINREVLPDVGSYLDEYFWQDFEEKLTKKYGNEVAAMVIKRDKSTIESNISKMAANLNISVKEK